MSAILPESPNASTKPPTFKFNMPPPVPRRPISLARRIDAWFYVNIRGLNRSPRPLHIAFMLLWPFPWKYPLPPPLSVQELLDDPDIVFNRRHTEVNYVTLRQIERFCYRDTPLRSLYRLYETVVADNEDEMMQESQYWFHRQTDWLLADIPDPQDPDPIRYAILASLTDALVLSFNYKIKYGMRRGITNKQPLRIAEFRNDPNPPLESSPAWCNKVGALSQRLRLVPGTIIPSDLTLLPGPLVTDNVRPFDKRNITAIFDQLYNI
ncbi:hypothetical protein JR316_0001174 [Psilocybe cubensis]|uniref:Uncharacterized protein n=2 Tax=Psilocybe cubensis TaxID=181762 RepID=A0A8H7YAW5_PSICU|nr:hypothetical protein JR316_0001174 [Psilocybe cubensis]KAH9487106.1 hypothetical protein JR316_0001174 [Psilocybe cubensis]